MKSTMLTACDRDSSGQPDCPRQSQGGFHTTGYTPDGYRSAAIVCDRTILKNGTTRVGAGNHVGNLIDGYDANAMNTSQFMKMH